MERDNIIVLMFPLICNRCVDSVHGSFKLLLFVAFWKFIFVSLPMSHLVLQPLSYFSFQPDWCIKGCCMYYPVYGIVHIKELLIGKSSPCGSSGFPLPLSEWSSTICLIPYNSK